MVLYIDAPDSRGLDPLPELNETESRQACELLHVMFLEMLNERSVNELAVSTRAARILERNKIKTCGHLVERLLHNKMIPGAGSLTLSEYYKALGLWFGGYDAASTFDT